MRLPVSRAGLLTAALLAAGCTHAVAGHAVAPSSHAGRPLSAGELERVLLAPSQLSGIVGAKLELQADVDRPVAGDPAEGTCAALDSAGMEPFVGDSFTAFRLLLLSDGNPVQHDHVITEAAAVYPDAASAAKVFSTATSGLAACNGQQVQAEATWRFAVSDSTADTVRWNKEQADLPMLWVCYGQARVRVNVIIQALSCQGDDGGKANAETILNRMSATVWELSGT